MNVERRRKRLQEQYGPPAYRRYVSNLPCIAGRDCQGNTEIAHVTSRGAGGKAEANVVPLCTKHHREQHTLGINTFQDKHNLDMDLEASLIWQDYHG